MTENTSNEQQKKPNSISFAKLGMLITTIAVAIFVIAFGFGYFALSKANFGITRTVSKLQLELRNNQQLITMLQKTVGELQQSMQKSQDLSAQQEKMLSEWQAAEKGNLEKWYVAEAQYLVRLANDYLQFTHNISLAKAMLQRADQVLQNLQNSTLIEIRKSLANDLANLEAAPEVDVTELYLQLNTINNQLDKLPFPASPLKVEAAPTPSSAPAQEASWWKKGLESSWESLRKIVVVRNTAYHTLPLVMPEQKTFLLQNLHAEIESAMWAVIHHSPKIYQTSLAQTIIWVRQYMDQDAEPTKLILENLDKLMRINIEPPTMNLSSTLQQFDNYFLAQVHVAQ